MKSKILIAGLFMLVLLAEVTSQTKKEVKTIFQTSESWKTETDVRADASIIYGTSDRKNVSFEQRVQSWRNKGYETLFMTGIAWGNYQDYFTGKWDGNLTHMGEGQKTLKGDTISHGYLIPYIVPTSTFIQYMKEKQIKRVIDAGITSIFLEEPEFWMRAGYSDAFKKEWQLYYHFPWRAQDESPENTYLSNKLKYHLYYNAINEIFTYAKKYGKSKGLDVKCYIPTHSLINYTSWQIVSPEASLASLPCIDGYIAQVWTGTAREPTYYNGLKKERVFENAFLEYGCMQSMTAPTGRKVYFLTDPIEDRNRDWNDYKINYQATFVAQLLYPMVDSYEVMPWPDRIYQGLYNVPNSSKKEKIPRSYSTQMQIMINSLNDIKKSANKINGTHGIGVLMANSLMFQRFPDHNGYDDPQFSSFYGQTFPLLKRGIPVELIHIENTSYKETFKDLKVLIISYSNMKPLDPKYHTYISNWVKKGGSLIYCGEDIDPYQSVMEWWNTNGNSYKVPSSHLFKLLGLTENPKDGKYTSGKGTVFVIREDPKHFVLKANNDQKYFSTVVDAYKTMTKSGSPEIKNNLYLERGPYIITAVLDENESKRPLVLSGLFIDLFDMNLPVLTEKTVNPGEQSYLYNIQKIVDKGKSQVLCGASRVYNETSGDGFYTFVAKSPLNTNNVSRVFLPQKPKYVSINEKKDQISDILWDQKSQTYLLKFENNPVGVRIKFEW